MPTTSRANRKQQHDERLIYWLRWKKEQTILRQREKNNNSNFLSRLEDNNSGGQFNKEFLRRLGVQNAAQLKNIPTRRITGK